MVVYKWNLLLLLLLLLLWLPTILCSTPWVISKTYNFNRKEINLQHWCYWMEQKYTTLFILNNNNNTLNFHSSFHQWNQQCHANDDDLCYILKFPKKVKRRNILLKKTMLLRMTSPVRLFCRILKYFIRVATNLEGERLYLVNRG